MPEHESPVIGFRSLLRPISEPDKINSSDAEIALLKSWWGRDESGFLRIDTRAKCIELGSHTRILLADPRRIDLPAVRIMQDETVSFRHGVHWPAECILDAIICALLPSKIKDEDPLLYKNLASRCETRKLLIAVHDFVSRSLEDASDPVTIEVTSSATLSKALMRLSEALEEDGEACELIERMPLLAASPEAISAALMAGKTIEIAETDARMIVNFALFVCSTASEIDHASTKERERVFIKKLTQQGIWSANQKGIDFRLWDEVRSIFGNEDHRLEAAKNVALSMQQAGLPKPLWKILISSENQSVLTFFLCMMLHEHERSMINNYWAQVVKEGGCSFKGLHRKDLMDIHRAISTHELNIQHRAETRPKGLLRQAAISAVAITLRDVQKGQYATHRLMTILFDYLHMLQAAADIPTPPRGATSRWMSNQHRRWAEAEAAAPLKCVDPLVEALMLDKVRFQFHALDSDVHSTGFQITPIDTVEGLFEEGLAMKHCIATHARDCYRGIERCFSICRSGHRVASVSIKFDYLSEQWLVDQVRGKCNAEADDDVSHLANLIAYSYPDTPHPNEFERIKTPERLPCIPRQKSEGAIQRLFRFLRKAYFRWLVLQNRKFSFSG